MPAPDLAYRLACAPVDAVGGATAQHVALLAAMRWAQPDGRFILRQVALQAATGLSERPISAAVKALRSAKVFVPLGADEWLIAVEHLHRIGGESIRNGGPSGALWVGGQVARPSEKEVASASGAHEPGGGRFRPDAARPSESEARASETAAPTAAGPQAVSPLLDVSASLPPNSNMKGGEIDARAGEAPPAGSTQVAAAVAAAGDPFTDLEERQLAWLAARGALLVNPATGELLGREWLRLTAGLGTDLVKRILAARVGDFPSDFRKASEAFATQVEAARRGNVNAEVDRAMAEAARHEAAERASQQAKLDEEQARQRGPYLEQARVLLAEISTADPRLLVLADSGFAAALVRLRSDVAAGRVLGLNLVHIRTGWPAVRDRQLPPDPPAPAPEPRRDFTEPAEADPEPAAP